MREPEIGHGLLVRCLAHRQLCDPLALGWRRRGHGAQLFELVQAHRCLAAAAAELEIGHGLLVCLLARRELCDPRALGWRRRGHGAQLFELVQAHRRLAATGRTLAEEAGGLSGRPLRGRALEVLRRLRATAGPALPLIGVGGIDSAPIAWERITAGASLVQVYTGWIYGGPELVPRILEGLIQQLDRHGLRTLAEAVGSGLPWR